MTTVVGIVDGEHVYLGADSMATAGKCCLHHVPAQGT